MSEIFWAALGLVLIFEGILPFLMPESVKKAWSELSQFPAKRLRIGGFGCMIVGLLILLITH